MTSNPGHPELGPELRALAQAILDRLDPTIRAAAAMAVEGLRGPGSCQQVWCPVCALAALINGEQHPMLTVIAEHSVSLLAVIRAMVAEPGSAQAAEPADSPQDAAGPPPPPADDPGGQERSNGSRYQHIPIVIETTDSED